MISSSLCTRENMDKLLSFANQDLTNPPVVRFDPAVNKALTYAVAYGLVIQQKTGNYKLTNKGKNFAEQIILVGDLMVMEINYLSKLSKKLTEGRIKDLTDVWRIGYVEN